MDFVTSHGNKFPKFIVCCVRTRCDFYKIFLIQSGNSLGLGLPCYTENMKYVIE